ncbi:MAG: alpha/beta hydrolase [Bacteroidetes bacterium]|nr:alpha/beta hydrolase [Bacteroidota bacterium]
MHRLIHFGVLNLAVAILALPHITMAQSGVADARKLAHEAYEQVKADISLEEEQFGRFIQTPNVRMHYLDRGPNTGTPLIWAPGTYSSAHELDWVADELVSAGLRIITIDYYGHGLTPLPDHPVSVYHVADDMAFLLDHLGIERALVGGWSRGGTIAAAFYDSFPEHTMALILEDGGSVAWRTAYDHSIGEFMSNIPEVYKPDEYKSEFDLLLSLAADSLLEVDLVAAHINLAKGFTPDENGRWTNQAVLTRWLWEDTKEHGELMFSAPHKGPLFERSTLQFEPKVALRDLSVPALILDPVSDDDFFRMTDGIRELKEKFPDLITHSIYPDTGHGVHYQRAEQFISDVVAFLEDVGID